MKYKLIEKSAEPGVKESSKKLFYATALSDRAMDARTFAKAASVGMALTPGEMQAALEQFGTLAMQHLLSGRSVEVPGIGTLRISFSSKGVEVPSAFHAQSMITKPRIIFTPKPDVKDTIARGLQFENAGVRANGKNYDSIKDYTESVLGGGITGGGGTPSKPGTGDGGTGDGDQLPEEKP